MTCKILTSCTLFQTLVPQDRKIFQEGIKHIIQLLFHKNCPLLNYVDEHFQDQMQRIDSYFPPLFLAPHREKPPRCGFCAWWKKAGNGLTAEKNCRCSSPVSVYRNSWYSCPQHGQSPLPAVPLSWNVLC